MGTKRDLKAGFDINTNPFIEVSSVSNLPSPKKKKNKKSSNFLYTHDERFSTTPNPADPCFMVEVIENPALAEAYPAFKDMVCW